MVWLNGIETMRLLAVVIISSAMTTGFAASRMDAAYAPSEQTVVDPIVTGKTVSAAHKQRWLEERKRYRECPECALSQPFPGE